MPTLLSPLELRPHNVVEVWKAFADEIVRCDPKISQLKAGCLAAARILNCFCEAKRTFILDIESRVAEGCTISETEDDEYARLEESLAFRHLATAPERLSGYRPYELLDKDPLALRPWDAPALGIKGVSCE